MVNIYQKSEYRISLRSLVQKNVLAVFIAASKIIAVNLPAQCESPLLLPLADTNRKIY